MASTNPGSGVQIQQVSPKGLKIGEGPHWVAQRECLEFVDIVEGKLYRLYTSTGRLQTLSIEAGEYGSAVTFIIPVQNVNHPDLYVIGHGRSIALVEWPESDPDSHSKKVKVVLEAVDGDSPSNRFNDAKCDPQGRLWAGTMAEESGPAVLPKEKGNLYRLKSDLTLECAQDKVTLSNGLAWSPDHKTFYYIDSMAYSVDAFDYDNHTGKIKNRRSVVDFKDIGLSPDVPDGMCVDTNGDLWVACFFGAKVICINPSTRQVTRQIKMAATNITSVCFGGKKYDTLFVTSSSIGLTPEQYRGQPAGACFAITGLGVKGTPPVEFKIDDEALKDWVCVGKGMGVLGLFG